MPPINTKSPGGRMECSLPTSPPKGDTQSPVSQVLEGRMIAACPAPSGEPDIDAEVDQIQALSPPISAGGLQLKAGKSRSGCMQSWQGSFHRGCLQRWTGFAQCLSLSSWTWSAWCWWWLGPSSWWRGLRALVCLTGWMPVWVGWKPRDLNMNKSLLFWHFANKSSPPWSKNICTPLWVWRC